MDLRSLKPSVLAKGLRGQREAGAVGIGGTTYQGKWANEFDAIDRIGGETARSGYQFSGFFPFRSPGLG